MKKQELLKKGLAVMLCACMVQGTTPLPAGAEEFSDGSVAETEAADDSTGGSAVEVPNTGDDSLQELTNEEQDTGEDNDSQPQEITEAESDADSNFQSQDFTAGEPDAGADSQPQDFGTGESEVSVLMGSEGANGIATQAYAQTKTVHYIGASGTDDVALAEIVSDQYYQNQTVKWTSNQERCFVVEGNITIKGLIEVTGTVRLILADGATLNAERGIKVSSGNNLYIYSQSGNSGKLIAGAAYGSAIGGTQYGTSVGTDNINQPGAGNIYIFGGNITAETTAEEAAAIGGARGGQGGSVTICGGNVTATSKYGDGIGGGASFSTDYNGRKGSATIDASSITGGNLPEWNGVIYINKVRTIYGNTLLEENPSVPEGYTLYLPETETLTIPENGSLELTGTLVADGSVINNGTLTNTADFTDNGTFTNNGIFTNNKNAVFHKTVSNAAGAEFSNEKGSVTVNNSLTNKGTITNSVSATFTVGGKGSLDNQGTFTSSGTIQNDGSFTNSGTFSGTNRPLINNNTLTNTGDLTGETITNKQGATFTNEKEHKVTSKQFTNDGKVVNNGAFENSSGYTQGVSNAGEFLNNNSMNVSYINNSGTFVNKKTATVSQVTTNSGTFTNDGTFTGDSMAWNTGKFINHSTWTAYSINNGRDSLNGETKADAVIENSGTVNVSYTVTNYANIQNKGSITVSRNVVVKEGSSCSGVPIHLAERKVTYVQEDGSTKTETLEYDLPDTTLNSGTYLLDFALPSLTVNGEVTLILTGDASIKESITVNEGSTLNLYTASDSTHTLQAADIDGSGKVIVNSGKVAVSGKINQISVNNGEVAAGSIANLTVKKGTVSADSIDQAAVSGGNVKVNKKIDEITVHNGEITADSITTAKISKGIIKAGTIGKATGMSDNSGVIFADTISDTSNFKGIAFIGDTGRLYGITSLTLSTSFTVPEGKTFIVAADKSLFIPRGTVLTYAGIIKIEESGILYKVQDSCLQKKGNGQIIGTITENIKESLITYVMPDGTTGEKFAKSVTEETTQLTTPEGDSEVWYVVLKDISLSGQLNIQGNVNLILADGFNLNVPKGGIRVPAGSSLTIYGQNAGTGKLTAMGNSNFAGIGGSDGSYGTITINGGTVEATGGSRGAGIGGGNNTEGESAKSGKVIINGGNVTATGGYAAAGIGGGRYCRGNVEINDGTVKATGDTYGAGIGGGYWSCYYNDKGYDGRSIIHINGGEVTAKPGDRGAGIGSGNRGSAEITITGGKVNAEASGIDGYGSAIGGGSVCKGDHIIRITGGEIVINASKAFGMGNGGDNSYQAFGNYTISIEGGTVDISCGASACIYTYGENDSITISGGKVTARSTDGSGIYGKNISISGGVVDTETKHANKSGIGDTSSNITISGGIVRAANRREIEIEIKGDRYHNAIKAKQLTLNGNAVVYTSNIVSSRPIIYLTGSKEYSSGILFEGTNGSVYGKPIPTASWEVPADSTLTIENGQTVTVPADVTLVNKGQIVIKSGGHLTVKGTLDTENGTITNEGTIQSVGGTLKGENKISNSTGGVIMRITELAVTVGVKGQVTYGSPYEAGYKLKDGTKAPEVKEGTYQEKYTDADGTVLTEKPVNVGQYSVTVSYQTEDGTTCQGSADFSIIKATATLTEYPEAETLTYNGTEQALVKEGATQDGTIQYKLGENGEWSEEVPTAKNAGDYVVYYQIIGDQSHNNLDAIPVNVSIEKKNLTVTITPNGGTYGGTITPAEAVIEGYIDEEKPAVTLTYSGTANNGTVVSDSTEPPTNAGTYKVTASVSDFSDSNYKLPETTEAEFTVARASAGLAVKEVEDKTVGADDFKLEVTRGDDGTGTLSYVSSDEKVLTVSEDGTVSIIGAGTATITVSLEESANYLADTAEVTVTVKKNIYEGHSLTLGDEIGVNFYMNIPETARTDDAYMEFSVSGKGGKTTRVELSEVTPGKDGRYKFTCRVNAIQMADTITATYHYGDETAVNIYSVKQYVEAVRADDNQSNDVKRLVEALADYGYYAQLCLSETNGWELNKDHAEMIYYTWPDRVNTAWYLENYAYRCEGSVSGITGVGTSLSLDSRTAINLYFMTDGNLTGIPTIVVKDKNGNTVAYNFFKVDGNRYRLIIPGISAHKLGDTYTITVNDTMTIQTSALSYAYTVLNSEQTTIATKRAVATLYQYYRATIDYRKSVYPWAEMDYHGEIDDGKGVAYVSWSNINGMLTLHITFNDTIVDIETDDEPVQKFISGNTATLTFAGKTENTLRILIVPEHGLDNLQLTEFSYTVS